MLGLNGNLWYFHEWDYWIVIPTNGHIKTDGTAVMGKGLAKQLTNRYPEYTTKVGQAIKNFGNRPFAFTKDRIITFPVKHTFTEKADLALIENSAVLLVELVDKHELEGPFYLPHVGCGNGKRNWETEVHPILKDILDDRFVVIKLTE